MFPFFVILVLGPQLFDKKKIVKVDMAPSCFSQDDSEDVLGDIEEPIFKSGFSSGLFLRKEEEHRLWRLT